jgi:hypothetical protein
MFLSKKKDDKKIGMGSLYDDQARFIKFLMALILLSWAFIFVQDRNQNNVPLVIVEGMNGVYVMDNYPEKVGDIGKITKTHFVQQFLDSVNAYDSYKIVTQLPRGLNMMSSDLRAHYLKNVFTKEKIKKIMALKISSTTTIKSLKFSDTKDKVIVSVEYERKLRSLKTPPSKLKRDKIIFHANMELRKLKERTKHHPLGLMAESFNRGVLSR